MNKKTLLKTIGITLFSAMLLQGCSIPGITGDDSAIDPAAKFDEVFDQETLSYIGKNEVEIEGEEQEEETEEEDSLDLDIVVIDELGYDDDYCEEIDVGTRVSVDLDGDGTYETVYYNAVTSATAEYGRAVEAFTINDGDFKYTLFLSDQGIHVQDPDLESYFITDLDTRDRYREIAICDNGANGTPYTYFIRYIGTGTYCLGYVPYFPSDDFFTIKGNGTVESAFELSILFKSWKAPAKWASGSDQFISSNLTMFNSDIYYPYEDQFYEPIYQIADLYLYDSKSTAATKTLALKSDKETCKFTQTDNKNWVYMERSDGVKGWIFMKNSEVIVNNGIEINCLNAFKNLN